jgi:chromosomal replication initiation ATPase DnaA
MAIDHIDVCARIDRLAADLAALRILVRPDREPVWRGSEQSNSMVIDTVASYYQAPADVICGLGRTQLVSRMRMLAAAQMRFRYQSTTIAIGESLNRDHTTIIYLLRKHADLVRRDRGYLTAYEDLTELLDAADTRAKQ